MDVGIYTEPRIFGVFVLVLIYITLPILILVLEIDIKLAPYAGNVLSIVL